MKKIKMSILTLALSAFVLSCSNGDAEHSEENGHHDESAHVEGHEHDADHDHDAETVSSIAKDVDADEFKTLFESGSGTLLDVRTLGEVEAGAIEGSVNIDFNGANFKDELAKLDKSKPVYVYCAAGGRSGQAMGIMKDMGFSEVYNLVGGYGNWPYK